MRTSPATQSCILWALEHNVKVAKSKAMREFAQTRLDDYKAELARRQVPARSNPFDRFVAKLETQPTP